jgi:site-specific DNA-methyltransferase (adenine-specific)
MFSDWRQGPNVFGLLESAGFRVNHQLVWDKMVFGMGAHYRNQHELITFASLGKPSRLLCADRGTVFHHKAPHPNVRFHPTEKPVPLLIEILECVSFKRALDPFMGSGSTIVAAKRLGKKAIGIDIDPECCRIAKQRIQQLELPEVE